MGSRWRIVVGAVGAIALVAFSCLCVAVLAVALLFDNYNGHNYCPD